MQKLFHSLKVAALIPLLLIASIPCFVAGCVGANGQDKIQSLLNATLPSEFVGDAHVDHFNPWFDFTIDATGLRKNSAGLWQWDGLVTKRKDRFSNGGVTLTPKPRS